MRNTPRYFASAFSLSIAFAVFDLSCSPATKSPQFAPGTVLTVEGQFLNSGGTALAETPVQFRNIRYFGYIDWTKTAEETTLALLLTPLLWPFFLSQDYLQQNKYEEHPNTFLNSAQTDESGKFRFQFKAENLLRDSEGGINITLVNDSSKAQTSAKFSFVLKKENSQLGSIRLQDPPDFTAATDEQNGKVVFSWGAPSVPLKKLFLQCAEKNSRSPLWIQELTPNVRTVEVSTKVFQSFKSTCVLESYPVFEADKKFNSTSRFVDVEIAKPEISAAVESRLTAPEIKFKITSLTNGKFDDEPFLEPFKVRSLVLDLAKVQNVSEVVMHNLKLVGQDKWVLSHSTDGSSWTQFDPVAEMRFVYFKLSAPVQARFLRFDFSSDLRDLAEVAVFQ